MKNYKDLLKFIKTNRILSECIAEKLGITANQLIAKLESPMTLTVGELVILKSVFHFSAKETIYIFAPWVAYRNY